MRFRVKFLLSLFLETFNKVLSLIETTDSRFIPRKRVARIGRIVENSMAIFRPMTFGHLGRDLRPLRVVQLHNHVGDVRVHSTLA